MKNILIIAALGCACGCGKKQEQEKYETAVMHRKSFELADHGKMQHFGPASVRGVTSDDDGKTWDGSAGFAEGHYSYLLAVHPEPRDLEDAEQQAVDSMSKLVEKTALPDGYLVVALNEGAKQYEVHVYRKTGASAWSHCEISMMGRGALPNQAVVEKMKQECLSHGPAE